MSTITAHPTELTGKSQLTVYLLVCGMVSSLLYIGMYLVIPMFYDGYDIASQTVSELSAIGAPTRNLWIVWVTIYTILLIAFGLGVIMVAGQSRTLRAVGILMILHSIFGLFWPPMHQREILAAGGGTLTDTLHIVWTMITVPMFILEVGLGAMAFGKGFRWYSFVSIVIIIAFGLMTGLDAPQMQADLPTPWMGIWERINIAAFMIWVMVFAVRLLKRSR